MMPAQHMVDQQTGVSSPILLLGMTGKYQNHPKIHRKNGLKGRNDLLRENPQRDRIALNPLEIVTIPHTDNLMEKSRRNRKVLLLKTCVKSWTNKKRIPTEEIEKILNHHQEGLKLGRN